MRVLLVSGLLLLLLTGGGARGQAPQFVETQWTAVENGMPSNDVRTVVQTEDGYLWLGTEGGLVRFDGTAFDETRITRLEARLRANDRVLRLEAHRDGLLVLYRDRALVHYTTEGATTIDERVWTYRTGPEGRLWIGGDDGVATYHRDTLTRVAPTEIDAQVRSLLRTGDGTLWVGTKGQGLYRRTPDGRVTRFTTEDGLRANLVSTLAEDGEALLVGTGAGVQRWHDGRFTRLPATQPADAPLQVVHVRGDVQGTCWVQAVQAVYRCREGRLVPYTGTTRSYELRPKFLSKDFVQEGPEGHLLVNTGRTLYRDGEPIFETEFGLWSVTPDREGTLWVGTGSRGLFQLRPSTVAVYGVDEGLPHNTVTTVARRQDGSVWMGTRPGGLVHFRSGNPKTYTLRKAGRPLRPIFALHEDRSGRLWVGGTRLCRVEGGQCARPEAPGPIPRTLITSIHEDRQGRLWVGTLGRGLFRRAPDAAADTAAWTQMTPQNSALPSREVRWLHESPEGTLWVATVDGPGGTVARYREGALEVLPDSLFPGRHPSFLHQDTTGVLWVGTTEYGLHRVDLREGDTLREADITSYDKQNGLHHSTVYQIASDDQGRLWINTPNGLYWVEKAALRAVAEGRRERVPSVVYTTRDGLRNVEGNGFGVPGAARTPDGRLWFPNQAGATVVDPATVPVRAAPPRMNIEAVGSGDSLVTDAPGAAVALAEHQRTFQIEYTGVRTSDPRAVSFRYRLAGLQDDWVRAGDRRDAFFTEVPSGTYTFEVAGRTRQGPWSAQPARLSVTVAPYFYETWWFYGLCVLGLGLVGAGLVRYRVYTLQRRKEELRRQVEERTEALSDAKQQAEAALSTVEEQAAQLRELDEMKSRFFANVSHELRTPLSLILDPVRRMQEEDERPSEERERLALVQRNAERLERLVGQLLDLARYDAGHLTRSPVRQEWGGFVAQVAGRFVPMAETQEVALAVDTDEAEAPVVFDPDHMETVIANLVRNALAYTPSGGTVTVRAAVDAEAASLTVIDTGPGIPEAEQETLFERFYRGARQTQRGGTGIGLSLTKALVELHEGTIAVDSHLGEGSRFTVTWPAALPEEETTASANDRPDPGAAAASPSGDGLLDSEGELGGDGRFSEDEAPGAASLDDAPDSVTPPSVDRTTVLVVEDHADVRSYVRSLLEPRYRVLEAKNGREGLKAARSHLPDLVVADVMMPEVNGFDLLRALRRSERTKTIPVLMLTARVESDDQVEGLQEGADAYVTKPFDAEVLRARVDGLIATRRQLRERFRTEDPPDAGEDPVSVQAAETFEEQVRTAVRAHLADSDFTVEQLAEEVGRTRRTVTRRVKEAFGQTPSQLIREMRVERGAELLAEEAGTVSEVAYAVGFNSLSYFSRSFKEHFGMPPSQYTDEA